MCYDKAQPGTFVSDFIYEEMLKCKSLKTGTIICTSIRNTKKPRIGDLFWRELESDFESNYLSLWDYILPVGQFVAYSDIQNTLVWSPNMKIIKRVGKKNKFKKT